MSTKATELTCPMCRRRFFPTPEPGDVPCPSCGYVFLTQHRQATLSFLQVDPELPLVARLRDLREPDGGPLFDVAHGNSDPIEKLCAEAADEIERLTQMLPGAERRWPNEDEWQQLSLQMRARVVSRHMAKLGWPRTYFTTVNELRDEVERLEGILDGMLVDPKAKASIDGDQDTSRSAAAAVWPRTGTQRHKLLDAYRTLGPMTDDDAVDTTGLQPNSLRPRRNELVEGRWVEGYDTKAGPDGLERIRWWLTPAAVDHFTREHLRVWQPATQR